MKISRKYLSILFVVISFVSSFFASCSNYVVNLNDYEKTRSYTPATTIAIGDVVMNDGTFVSVKDIDSLTDYEKSKAVAVIAFENDGKYYGVGLRLSDNDVCWALNATTGYKTCFTNIICTASLTGDLDGSDNWAEICQEDLSASTTPANYPAFNFACNYASSAGLLDSSYSDGWYIPTISELNDIYSNWYIVNASIDAVGGMPLDNRDFWSSSQDEETSYVFWINYRTGSFHVSDKTECLSVVVVRAF